MTQQRGLSQKSSPSWTNVGSVDVIAYASPSAVRDTHRWSCGASSEWLEQRGHTHGRRATAFVFCLDHPGELQLDLLGWDDTIGFRLPSLNLHEPFLREFIKRVVDF